MQSGFFFEGMLRKEMERRKKKPCLSKEFRKMGRLMIRCYIRSGNSGKTRHNISLKD